MTGPNPDTLGIDAIIQDPGKLQWVLSQTGLAGSDLQSMLQNAMLGYGAAGSAQWNQNVASGAQGDMPAALQNVGMDMDINSLRRIVGEATGMLSRGQGAQLKNLWTDRFGRVRPMESQLFPEMVGEDIYGQLLNTAGGTTYGAGTAYEGQNMANTIPQGQYGLGKPGPGQGLRWAPELLADPGINMDDPNAPLFDPANPPPSLSQLTGFQRGESAMLASMSPTEFIQQIMPRYIDYFNRAPGAPAPGLGPMFGESSYDPSLSGNFITQRGEVLGNPVQRGWLTETPAYERWSAYGQPGTGMPGAGTVRGAYGDSINPMTGQGSPGQGQPGNSFAQALLSGQVSPEFFAGDYQPGQTWADNPSFVRNVILPALGSIGTAAFLGDPSYYFASYPGVQEGMTEDALSRLMQLATARTQQQVAA